MSYLNGNTGYRKDILTTRSVIKKGNYAILEPDGLVKNTIPGFEQCEIAILGSPLLGASFVDYLVNAAPGGGNRTGFGVPGEGMYVLDQDWIPVKKGDYLLMGAYCPQAAYGVGREALFAYIYSKDCNRDIRL